MHYKQQKGGLGQHLMSLCKVPVGLTDYSAVDC